MALLFGCASSNPAEDEAEVITRVGIITAKEVVDLEDGGRKTNTSVSTGVSVSSGGGFSIGLGVLLSPWTSSSSEDPAVRYHVRLADGDELDIYHESDLFQVDDCVEITSREGDDETPPTMVRIKGDC